ncbi:hypothetical protein GE09DRAFT_1236545 [Coniochaeta sp. 2T2.1]|nr:hypothetical protein GE09DRAFT_1236545 [Coniochaeta sp. 2T2.1]
MCPLTAGLRHQTMPFPNWSTPPNPGVSLSAGGLLALADLSTTAQRTAIAGGSSWLGTIVLVPGLHYNQAADQLSAPHNSPAAPSSFLSAVETLQDGQSLTTPVRNAATADYIRRVARPRETVTLDVVYLPSGSVESRFRLTGSRSGGHATVYAEGGGGGEGGGGDGTGLGWLTEYLVSLGNAAFPCKIRLRGTPDDLAAITQQAWLCAKTHVEGYLEAAAKLIVYLVACLGGNGTQARSIIFMGLLLVSAGLLALSNAHAKGYRMNGRVAAVLPEGDDGGKSKAIEGVRESVKGGDGAGKGEEPGQQTSSWPCSSDASGYKGMDDRAEKGQVRGLVEEKKPFDKAITFE